MKGKKVLVIMLICVLVVISMIIFVTIKGTYSYYNFHSILNLEACSSLEETNNRECLIEGEFLSDDVVTDEEFNAMRYNTSRLQAAYDSVLLEPDNHLTINLPAGTFYFISSGVNISKFENVAINLKNNVSLIGAGMDESSSYTLLKPYSPRYNKNVLESDCHDDYENCVYNGLDMFYYKPIEGKYLENVSFSNFIIDGGSVHEVGIYNTSGKGFMINFCKNCHWNNVVVKNTAGTGFGMDCLIDATITNCKAINNGRRAREWAEREHLDIETQQGASGFGIGTGNSNNESVIIKSCESIGNAKYGYFFEHQGRFSNYYTASTANGFVVEDSSSENNMFNYGGERGNDIAFINNSSTRGEYTRGDIMYRPQSRNVYTSNMNLTNAVFNDVSSSAYYHDAVYWALSNGITTGLNLTTFSPDGIASRISALTMLWRMTGMQGDVLHYESVENGEKCGAGGLSAIDGISVCIETGFSDIPVDSDYTNPIIWGINNNIVKRSNNFNPENDITTIALIYFLHRYNDSLTNSVSNDQLAMTWANNAQLFDNLPNEVKEENHSLKRAEVVQILYNYNNSTAVNFPINYLLMGNGNETITNTNPTYYSYSSLTNINNLTKNGYDFVGWIGSNGTTPGNVSLNNTTGSKIYVAMWNKYELTFKDNIDYLVDEDKNIIYRVPSYSEPNYIINGIDSDATLVITDKLNNPIENNHILKTGYKLKVILLDNEIEYKISVIGDVLGSGEISRANIEEIAKHIINGNIITEEEAIKSADYNGDGFIKINDITKMLSDR